MTRNTNARIAGVTFLLYIAAGVTGMVLSGRMSVSGAIADRLAGFAQHAGSVGVLVLLGLVEAFSALVLAVTLYAVTRDQDRDLALLALTCRVTEGIVGAVSIARLPALVRLATATGPEAPAAEAAHVLAGYLLRHDVALSATFFAVGSTLFAWLFLRGRMIPSALARLGVVASLVLVVALPLELAGFLRGSLTTLVWLPMLAFEVPLALWLTVRGVAPATADRALAHAAAGP